MDKVCSWIIRNKDWLFSGIGVVIISFILSLIWAFLWFLIKKLLPKKKKLQIKTAFKIAIEQNAVTNKFSPCYPVFSFEITNISTEMITIKSVGWNFCGKKITYHGTLGADGVQQLNRNDPNKYSQKQLNPSGIMTGNFNIVWFAIDKDIVEQFKPRDKIRLEVIDTLGNKYYSEKYRYSKFTEQVNIAKEVNRSEIESR